MVVEFSDTILEGILLTYVLEICNQREGLSFLISGSKIMLRNNKSRRPYWSWSILSPLILYWDSIYDCKKKNFLPPLMK